MIDLDTLFKISYGMYIVSSKGERGLNGCIVNSIFQITPEPVTIAVSINKQSLTCLYIEKGKSFSVSVLSEEASMQFIGRFGFCCGLEADKFKGVNYKIGQTGNPIILDNTAAYIEAEVIERIDIFTHTLFIARVVACETLDATKSPMTYSYYRDIRGGRTPKQAATYHKEKTTQHKKGKNDMKKYKCTVCGYIYNPEAGDPDSGVEPGTAFEDIPDEWTCPECGAPKEDFEPVEE